jgi:hypothetical protein
MRHLIGSLFAICLAGVAAIAATTALLNTPLHIGPTPAAETTPTVVPPPVDAPVPAPASGNAPVEPGGATPAPAGAPDAASPAGSPATDSSADEPDRDPYEGVAPEDLPPDLQYNADSSVSFPTNI